MQVDISLHNISLCQSDLSDIDQLDGNTSLNSRPKNRRLIQNASVAHHLPVVSVCNMRSLFPKVSNFKIDFFERSVDFSLCCEVWEKAESKYHMSEIEKMLEVDGLQYFSSTRPRGKRGGGARGCYHCKYREISD